MDDFIDALKQKDLKKIRACPKGDLHDHFVLGGSRRYLRRTAGVRLQQAKRPRPAHCEEKPCAFGKK